MLFYFIVKEKLRIVFFVKCGTGKPIPGTPKEILIFLQEIFW
jgi:hypothetical protein